MIFELLTEKINDLLGSLVFINFVPETIPNGPHECIEEIIDFLRVTFMWLTHLPQSIRDAIHFTCCSRVANGILEYLLSPTTFTKVNILCLLAFQYDIRKLILFSDSCGVTYLKQSFEELSEIINICFHVELPQFGDHVRTRQHLFPHVSPGKLASLLEKVFVE